MFINEYRISDIGEAISNVWFGWKHRGNRGLRHWVLAILRRSPKNGAEIMDEIEGMTQGWWRPSPGSVYPMLDAMTTDGLIKKRDDGRYELTENTRRESEWPFGFMGGPFGPQRQNRTVEEMLNEINGFVSYFEDLAKTDKVKLSGHAEKVQQLADRLAALTK